MLDLTNDTVLLSLIIFLPSIGALLLLLFPRGSDTAMKWATLGITIATCALCFVLFNQYTKTNAKAGYRTLQERAAATELGGGPQRDKKDDFIVRIDWIEPFHIQYYLGVDGISLALVLLTGILSVLAMLASFPIEKHVRGYCILYLLLETGMLGVFLALDFFLFYVFFEVMLLPMYFLIGIWGGPRREYAAIKFFLYTLLGSVLILIAMLAFYFGSRYGGSQSTFDLLALQRIGQMTGKSVVFSPAFQTTMFILLFIGFAIKVPTVPFHTWLPDAHVEAPTPISMILAGVLLKIGGYGLIRIAYPICPAAANILAPWVAIVAVVSIIYGALAAMAQTDFKKLVAYSSVSHMGYVILGISVLPVVVKTAGGDPSYYNWGMAGAMFQMIAHGISSAGMFFLVGVIYERAHHRDLNRFGGLMNAMPIFGGLSVVIFFAGMGLPGLCGFVGEVFTVLAGFKQFPAIGILSALGVVLTAGYILWTIQRVYLGSNPAYEGTPDMNFREVITAIPLLVLAILLGVYPNTVLSWMGPDVEILVNQLAAFSNTQFGAAFTAAGM